MIRPLRQRHRVMMCALAASLPVAFVTGIAARKAVPIAGTIAPELAGPASGFGYVVWTKPDVWPDQRIITSLRRNTAGAFAVELMLRDLVKPDVLVYWAAGQESTTNGLPEGARLLGALSNRVPLPIPADIRGETGSLVLYSLADQEVVAVSKTFKPLMNANER